MHTGDGGLVSGTANGTTIAVASSSSFVEGAIPDFLQPLKDVARNAQRFAEDMKKKEEDLDAVANGRGMPTAHRSLLPWTSPGLPGASPGLSLIQEEMNANGERTDKKNIVKTPDAVRHHQHRFLCWHERRPQLNNSRDDSRKQALGEGLSLLEGASRSGDWEAEYGPWCSC